MCIKLLLMLNLAQNKDERGSKDSRGMYFGIFLDDTHLYAKSLKICIFYNIFNDKVPVLAAHPTVETCYNNRLVHKWPHGVFAWTSSMITLNL